MALYEIRWKSSAYQDLRRLDPSQVPRIVRSIESLQENPFPRGSRKLLGTEDHRRLRVGDLRVIYKVEQEPGAVVVIHVRHRREAYR
ncbi:MAG: type II toxin-antitoxin system RelE/ParE family toxin [Candidatus Bipolaricaulota bacterium]